MFIASALTYLVVTLFSLRLSGDGGGAATKRDFAALLKIIDELYIGEYDEDLLASEAMKAAVESLGDRWSYYMTPDEYVYFMDLSNNRYAGIGIGVAQDESTDLIKVLSVYGGSAAETAGLLADDLILAIDNEDIAGFTIGEMGDLLSREIGDDVDLTILRPDGSVVTITVVYSYVFVDPVQYEMLSGDIGYISVSNFDYGAADSFIAAAGELIDQGTRAFVFDVRMNGGGRVSEMTGMLDYLLPEGEIFIAVDRSGVETITLSDADMVDLPCVVLVDRNSYSAAEYFAATLSEYGYASVVGEQTSGKNRMQTTYTMPGGGALHLSTSQYLTKNRVSLYDVGGLTPDYLIVLDDDEYELLLSGNVDMEDDPHIQKALSLLKY